MFPGERLVVCRNPALAAERARKREALLAATEDALARVAASVDRGRLRTAAAIGLRAGRVVNARKVAKHFELDIAEGVFAYRRRTDAIAAEAALDGLYVVRTSVSSDRLDTPAVVETYKRLSAVERDFRALKGDDLAVRPIFHWREDRVRAHLFLCFLAAYVRWHLEQAWTPLLFRDEARLRGPIRSRRGSAPPRPSPRSATIGPPTASGWAASPRSWPNSPPSPATGSCRRDSAKRRRSTCCPSQPRSRPGRSS